MSLFNDLYETTPPPIISQGYKDVKYKYEQFMSSYTPPENSVVDTARQFIGDNYQWQGSTPSTGFDNLGLISYSFKQNGLDIPRSVEGIIDHSSEVPISNIQIGDLIQSSNDMKMVSNIDSNNIYVINAKGKRQGIIEEPFSGNINSVRRIKDNSYIINYFINKGLTLNQAKGIYGNIMQESSGNPRAVSRDGHNSYGLAQWTGDRKQRLFRRYGTAPTANQQLDFLWWELNNTHKSALNSLLKTTTVSGATKVFMEKFEVPHKDYAFLSRRIRFANSV